MILFNCIVFLGLMSSLLLQQAGQNPKDKLGDLDADVVPSQRVRSLWCPPMSVFWATDRSRRPRVGNRS